MKSFLSKIFLAQAITVVLALLVMSVITRVALNRGFTEFLEQQESVALGYLAPALADLYQERGGWDFLRRRPGNWERLLRPNRPPPPPRGRRGEGPELSAQPPEGLVLYQIRQRQFDGLRIRERLFLLDENRRHLAGAPQGDVEMESLVAIEVDGTAVGWIGFVAAREDFSPEARRFLAGQIRILGVSLLVALLLAAVPAFLLARHFSRPVRELDTAVGELAQGDYDSRALVATRDEIGRLARNVNRLAEILSRNQTARQRWMAEIAHELRTPVAILKGEIEAVADGVRPADERLTGSLKDEIGQLGALIDDLQALALYDAGALSIHRQETDLCELADQVAEAYRYRLAERKIRLELQCEPGLAAFIDPQRMRQLLQNLLENSARYVSDGGCVWLGLAGGEGDVRLTLEDDGPGVDDETLQALFQRFFRADRSRARLTGGSGLGLSICKAIVEAHGGEIGAEHGSRGGLKITARLPDVAGEGA